MVVVCKDYGEVTKYLGGKLLSMFRSQDADGRVDQISDGARVVLAIDD